MQRNMKQWLEDLVRSPEKKHPVNVSGPVRPDAVISEFPELLDLLPALN